MAAILAAIARLTIGLKLIDKTLEGLLNCSSIYASILLLSSLDLSPPKKSLIADSETKML
jgi:hypothetical protein